MISPGEAKLAKLETIELPDEPRSPCGQCPQGPRLAAGKPGLRSHAACCTYHPTLPNFRVGRVLRRGGQGSVRMARRLKDGKGRLLGGITSPWPQSSTAFGTVNANVCPFFGQGCEIYPDRGPACRSYHCKTRRGNQGRLFWESVGEYFSALDDSLARFCVERVTPAPSANSEVSRWLDYYVACYELVELGHWHLDVFEAKAATNIAWEICDAPMADRLTFVAPFRQRATEASWWLGVDNVDVLEVTDDLLTRLMLLKGRWQDTLTREEAERLYEHGLLI